MEQQLTIINKDKLDISKPAQFAVFVEQARRLQNTLNEAWTIVEQQMLDRNVKEVSGAWGSVRFEPAELLTVIDADVLDPAITKPSLDTKKVRAYRELMGALPAGVGTKTITKFAKRIKK